MSNSISIVLPAHLEDDLKWDTQKALADEAVERGAQIVWEFDFAIRSFCDQTHFQSYVLALEQFIGTLWKDFQTHTSAICLYRGSLETVRKIECDQTSFQEWLADTYGEVDERSQEYFKALFLLDYLAGYLHRLGAFLPTEVDLLCHFQVSPSMSLTKASHLFSKARFAHLRLCMSGLPLNLDPTAPLAICLPEDHCLTLENLSLFEEVLLRLKNADFRFRIIPESILTEEWTEVDALVVLEPALSLQGKRKLQGFCAAGGEVWVVGQPLGLPKEVSWERKIIGAEGFEPPTHCSQSSCASQTALCSD